MIGDLLGVSSEGIVGVETTRGVKEGGEKEEKKQCSDGESW